LPPKIIYYPPPGPERLTTQQLVGWVVILGLGAFGVTSTVAMVIKVMIIVIIIVLVIVVVVLTCIILVYTAMYDEGA
jgi:hypothetical protein